MSGLQAEWSILDRMYAAARAVDDQDPARYGECLAPEATFRIEFPDGTFRENLNRDEILAASSAGWQNQPLQRRHVINNASIQVVEQTASVISYLTLYATGEGATKVVTTGVYRDQLKRDGDNWLFISRRLTCDAKF